MARWSAAQVSIPNRLLRLSSIEKPSQSQVLRVLEKWHSEEVNFFPCGCVSIELVEADSVEQRRCRIQSDSPAVLGPQLTFSVVQKALCNPASLPIRPHGHSTQVAFSRYSDIERECANDILVWLRYRNQHTHFPQADI